ncbi:DUF2934 domain-containing protein [Thiocapsa bogorovii]|uniref:DUF2934 domain-containing protein n=1 Tax=Thiocapsa bogorovii TaxID=521689 RepID=UPI001E5BCFED|nr:DUF2934 domain-containing protein [Thiocapsa bogorovii]UHD15953.1 DUF2934 domain-containing protein [Thiocapsa bogorovii]
MADDKTIVTKKTAPKAAVDSKNPVIKKTVAKKAPTKAAAVKPAAKPAPGKAPAPPAKTATKKKAAPSATRTATATPVAKKTPAKKAPAKSGVARNAPESKSISLKLLANVSDEERMHMIHEAAYYRAEKRRFAPGHEAEDWVEAEREIDDLLANAKRISGR